MTEFWFDLLIFGLSVLGLTATFLWRWHHRYWAYVLVAVGGAQVWLRRKFKGRWK